MLCDECKQNPARVHFTRMVNGTLSQVHLCERCMQRLGYAGMFSALTAGDIIGQMMQTQQSNAVSCENCKRTMTEIQQSGLLGCPKCYEAFAPQIEVAVNKAQGRSEHRGKSPSWFEPAYDPRMEIEESRKALSEAVKAENYEKAAELRDRIREMEQELLGGADNAVKE